MPLCIPVYTTDQIWIAFAFGDHTVKAGVDNCGRGPPDWPTMMFFILQCSPLQGSLYSVYHCLADFWEDGKTDIKDGNVTNSCIGRTVTNRPPDDGFMRRSVQKGEDKYLIFSGCTLIVWVCLTRIIHKEWKMILLEKQLEKYQSAHNEQEEKDLMVIQKLLAQESDIFERSCLFAHMTASAWVSESGKTKVIDGVS